MTLELVYACGPEVNDSADLALGSGFSLVSSPAPPSSLGTYRIKATGTVADSARLAAPSSNLATKPFQWAFFNFRLDGTLTSGQRVKFARLDVAFARNVKLFWIYESASSYRIELRDDGSGIGVLLGTSIHTFSVGADHTVSLSHSSDHILNLLVDNVTEISLSSPYPFDVAEMGNTVQFNNDVLAAGQTMYWDGYGGYHGDDASERPDPSTLWRRFLPPNSDTAESEYRSQVGDCLTDNGTYTNVDDWASGGQNDGLTTYSCGPVANAKEVYGLATATAVGDISGVITHYLLSANLVSKTVDNWARLKYGSDALEVQLPNLSATSLVPNKAVFRTPPGSAPWSQAIIDGLEVGHRVVSTNGATARVTALGVEVFAVKPFVPPTDPVDTVRIAFQGDPDAPDATLDVVYFFDSGIIIAALIQNYYTDRTLYYSLTNVETLIQHEGVLEPLEFRTHEINADEGFIYAGSSGNVDYVLA